jgi:hypothetical protein
MGSKYYRERYYKEEWTKRVDIALLYRLQMLMEEMKRRAIKDQDKEIERWESQIRLMLAAINGEVTNIRLDDKQLPDCGLQDLVNVATDQPALKLLARHQAGRDNSDK